MSMRRDGSNIFKYCWFSHERSMALVEKAQRRQATSHLASQLLRHPVSAFSLIHLVRTNTTSCLDDLEKEKKFFSRRDKYLSLEREELFGSAVK